MVRRIVPTRRGTLRAFAAGWTIGPTHFEMAFFLRHLEQEKPSWNCWNNRRREAEIPSRAEDICSDSYPIAQRIGHVRSGQKIIGTIGETIYSADHQVVAGNAGAGHDRVRMNS